MKNENGGHFPAPVNAKGEWTATGDLATDDEKITAAGTDRRKFFRRAAPEAWP